MNKDMCSKMDTQKVGNTYVIDSVCKMGPSTNTTHSVITGDFNSAYTVKLSSVTSGGPNFPGARPDGKTEMTMRGALDRRLQARSEARRHHHGQRREDECARHAEGAEFGSRAAAPKR